MLVTGLAFGSVTANAQSNADERISAIDNTPSVRPSSGGIEITVQGRIHKHFLHLFNNRTDGKISRHIRQYIHRPPARMLYNQMRQLVKKVVVR